MSHTLPTLDAQAQTRWQTRFKKMLERAGFTNQTQLAIGLSKKLGSRRSTVKSEISRLNKADIASVDRLLGDEVRFRSLAELLRVGVEELRAEFIASSDPSLDDPWSRLVGDSDQEWIPARLKAGDQEGDAAWWVVHLNEQKPGAAVCVRSVASGAGRKVAIQQLKTALKHTESSRLTILDSEHPSDDAITLDLLPWGRSQLLTLAEHLPPRGAPREAVLALADAAQRAPQALSEFLQPATVLRWVLALRDASASEPPTLQAFASGERWRVALDRSPDLATVGFGRLRGILRQWRLLGSRLEPWTALKRSDLAKLVEDSVEVRPRAREGSAFIRQLLKTLQRDDPKAARDAANELERMLLLDSASVVAALEAAGLVTETKQGFLPTDIDQATWWVAELTVEEDLAPGLLEPSDFFMMEAIGLSGIAVEQLVQAVHAAPRGRRHRAYQAAAMCLTASVDPVEPDAQEQAISLWAGGLLTFVRSTGAAGRPGYIQVAPSADSERFTAAMRRFSERARGWLPQLGDRAVYDALLRHAPDECVQAAAIWDGDLWEADTERFEQTVAWVCPWQCGLEALGSNAEVSDSAWSDLVLRIVLWRAECGETRSCRLVAGLEEEPVGLPHNAVFALFDLPTSTRLRALLALPASAPGVENATWAALRRGWPTTAAVDENAVELGVALVRRLDPAAVRAWLRVGLLTTAVNGSLANELRQEGEGPSPHLFKNQPGCRDRLELLVAKLEEHALLEELAALPTRMVNDPNFYGLLVRWPKKTTGDIPGLGFLTEEEIQNLLEPLVQLDALAERAAQMACRLGQPEHLRARWQTELTLPPDLETRLRIGLLILGAFDAGMVAWAATPADDELVTRFSDVPADTERRLGITVGPRVAWRKVLDDSNQPTVSLLAAVWSAMEQGRLDALEKSDQPLVRWLVQLATHEIAERDRVGEVVPEHVLAWMEGWSPIRLPQPLRDRTERAIRSLCELGDSELLTAAMGALSEDRWTNTLELQICREAWRLAQQTRENCWRSAPRPARRWLVLDVLTEVDLSEAEQNLWVKRVAGLDLDSEIRNILPRLGTEAAAMLGADWIDAATSPLERIDRSLQLHEWVPWHDLLLEGLRTWALDTDDPFGVSESPGAYRREQIAGHGLQILGQYSSGDSPWTDKDVRPLLERLWKDAIKLPARKSRRENRLEYQRYSLERRVFEPLHSLTPALVAAGLDELLVATWKRPPAPQESDQAWGEDERLARPLAIQAAIAREVVPRLDPKRLHDLRDGEHGALAAEALLEQGDERMIREVKAQLGREKRFDLRWSEEAEISPRIRLSWYRALDLLCTSQPEALPELFSTWLERSPDRRLGLLHALAGWTEPPNPVAGAAALLDQELERLFTT